MERVINSGLKMDKSVLRLKKSGLNDLMSLLPYPQNSGRILPKTNVCQNRRCENKGRHIEDQMQMSTFRPQNV